MRKLEVKQEVGYQDDGVAGGKSGDVSAGDDLAAGFVDAPAEVVDNLECLGP